MEFRSDRQNPTGFKHCGGRVPQHIKKIYIERDAFIIIHGVILYMIIINMSGS